ncbi:CCE1 [[Candida] subhashii]|uniref:CCE1 n=1 Tax=[Candida] subhashii TaxID=561895 RepID=A0A8J5QJK1_9ASCO|nr:CCE1 [[Candida] subhashii]KAG7662246.1 CCE1 [[Candida] subhashii]
MTSQIIEQLQACKVSTLNQIALLCGTPILSTTKSHRIQNIVSGYNFYQNHIPKRSDRTTLAIDVGIKNFSYCKSIGSTFPLKIKKWDKIDLNERYGSNYTPLIEPNSLLDQKRYLNYIGDSLINDVLKPWDDLVVMETQRTRSNKNTSTLPNVLLNYNLENIIINKTYPGWVLPMTSAKMIGFWFSRFIDPKSTSLMKKDNKILRRELVYSWIDRLYVLPGFDSNKINDKGELLTHLGINTKEKTDDLIDSLLYNLTINSHMINLKDFHDWIKNEKGDLTEFVNMKNQAHIELIQFALDKYKLKLRDI